MSLEILGFQKSLDSEIFLKIIGFQSINPSLQKCFEMESYFCRNILIDISISLNMKFLDLLITFNF